VIRKLFLLLSLAAALALPLAWPASAETTEEMLADRVLGNPKAPITIVEYFSMTCSHCARFHNETLPELKKAWIDTGKAKLVMRDFPIDRVALHAAVLARCLGPERYAPFVETLMKTQDTWIKTPDPRQALNTTARLAGLTREKAEACAADTKLVDGILSRQLDAQNKYKVDSTPSFVINEKLYPGAMPFKEFDRILKGN
jgi:protein-disulfide isomerase